jgi:hypothetical protein
LITYSNLKGGVRVVMEEYNELDSTCGVSDDELTKRFKEAIRIENEIKKIRGLPIAKYDVLKKAPYLEYPDGRREYD